jgi:hypothetical protein
MSITAEIIIPEDLKGMRFPAAVVEQGKNDREEQEVTFKMGFAPTRESPEYEAYVQKVLDALRDRTIERCDRK